jgi:hypothetical protein
MQRDNRLALALFVTGIVADHAHDTLAAHHLTLAAHFFYRSLHSHGSLHSRSGSELPD